MIKTAVKEFISNDIIPEWRWRTTHGHMVPPRLMETQHLFFTLRMIWNHSMPDDAKLHPYRLYRFRPFYSPEYMTEAIRHVGTELFTRDDINPRFRVQLDFMNDYLRSEAKKLPKPLDKLTHWR